MAWRCARSPARLHLLAVGGCAAFGAAVIGMLVFVPYLLILGQ